MRHIKLMSPEIDWGSRPDRRLSGSLRDSLPAWFLIVLGQVIGPTPSEFGVLTSRSRRKQDANRGRGDQPALEKT
jgi:hypothetical protein